MTQTDTLTPNEIRQAVTMIQRTRPSYGEILDFHGKVAIAQIESDHQIDPCFTELRVDLFEMKIKEGFPLLAVHQFVIDSKASGALMIKLCDIAMQANPVMANSAEKIAKALKKNRVAIDNLFKDLVSDAESSMVEAARDLNGNPNVLSFLTYNSTIPSILRCVEHLTATISNKTDWTTKRVCPICGSAPGISTLENEGKRYLVCHFCRYKWSVPRAECPFCENKGEKGVKYFYSDEEPEYRVDTCNHCKTYFKTIDTRELDRILYLPLEETATLHLDLTAQEKGFRQPAFIV